MKMTKFGYFSEFLLFPPLILAATLLAFYRPMPPRPIEWLIVFVVGLMGWTLLRICAASRAVSPRADPARGPRAAS